MQIAIDSAKRKFDIDLDSEMNRIKNDINVKENGLPLFWQLTKKDKRKCSSASERSKRQKQNLESIKSKINPDLVCPMNYLYNIELRKFRSSTSTLPMKHFFINYPAEADRRKSKQIEELIEKYSLEVYDTNINYTTININYEEDHMDMILEDDLEELINDISQIRMSGSYRGMMSWLINRALMIGTGVRQNSATVSNNTDRNRPVLMKVLYKSNPKVFLECFKKSLYT